MDTTKTTTHISLCSGYAGIDLGLKRVLPSLRTVAYSEIEAFACENLLARMEAGQLDPAPIWTDLKSFPWAEFSGRVDILSGGYPCQPFSAAGKRLGTEDPRHLWPYIASGIRLLRPRVCFFENVEGHISLGLSTVISDLEELGYSVSWGIFSAAECGAPHQRKRVFIMAHRKDKRLPQFANIGTIRGEVCSTEIGGKLAYCNEQRLEGCIQQGVSQNQKQDELASGYGRSLADANGSGSGQDWKSGEPRASGIEQSPGIKGRGDSGEVRERQAWPSRPGQPQHAWEPPRVVAHTHRGRSDKPENKHPDLPAKPSGSDTEGMGNAQNERRRRLDDESGKTSGWQARGHADGASASEQQEQRQTQPSLGGDTDGVAGGLDYAELSVSCDNRTDELRLLGNGVVPATAEKAFRTLLKQLWT